MLTFRDSFLFHHQVRLGKKGKALVITKFRTMPKNSHKDYDSNGRNDMLTSGKIRENKAGVIGKLIRRTRVDELPQILLLFKKQIRLLGLRPLSRQNYSKLTKEMKKNYLENGPGLFGIQYSLKPSKRTMQNIEKELISYYEQYQKHPTRTNLKYLAKIILTLNMFRK
ncbi:MAG TPA: sugar transferase [archaeon]|nr:sugar transferase [archaeon]